jgi:hypothetical protein
MLIEPRQVEPGSQRRWTRETLELLRRAPEVWILLALIFMATGFVAYPILGTGQVFLGLFQMYVVLHLAQVAGERHVQLRDIFDAFRLAGPRYAVFLRTGIKLWSVRLVLGMSSVATLAHCVLYSLGDGNPVQQFYSFNAGHIGAWLWQRQSPLFCAFYGVMWCAVMHGPLLMPVTVVVGNCDARLGRTLSLYAFALNRTALKHTFVFMFCVLMAGYYLSPLAPFVAIAFPLFAFVAVRDMFHGKGNRKLDENRKTQAAPQMT